MQIKFKRRYQASLTIYYTLLIACVGAVILALVEIARFSGLNSDAAEYTNLAEESLFAGYQPVLLEEYDMFWLDGSFGNKDFNVNAGEEEMEALLYDNLQSKNPGFGINFYKMRIEDVLAEKYLLATDRDGKVFQSQAAKVYRSNLGEKGVEEILKQIKKIQEAKNAGGNPESQITSAESGLEELKKQQAAQKKEGETASQENADTPKEQKKVENPLKVNRQIRKKDILSVVLPKGAVVSEKSVDISQSLLNRHCKKGTDADAIETKGSDRIFMQQYIKEYCGNFVTPSLTGSLSYGEEYVIAGKKSDQDNLKYVVNELLLIREAINFAYLNTDSAKKAEALSVAAAIAGATANPPIIQVIKQGILAVWAFGESICDVKILLSGGKVPLWKNSESWNCELSKLKNVVSDSYQGTEKGQSYEDYLHVLMFILSTKKVSYRTMDLMEFYMKNAGYDNASMDSMILRMKIKAQFQADTVFLSVFGEDGIGGYCFEKESSYCYQ